MPTVRTPIRPSAHPEKGFALLVVLWLVVVAGAVVASTMTRTGTSIRASWNRVVLTRAEWAREGCVEILMARWADSNRPRDGRRLADSVDLGRGAWCAYDLEDPTARVNLNRVDDSTLTQLLGSDSLAAAVLDWRDPDDIPRVEGAEAAWYLVHHRLPPGNHPFASVEELALVRGFDSARTAWAKETFTVRGPGSVNANLASPRILGTIPGLGPEAIAVLLTRRQQGRDVTSLDELLSLLSPAAQRPIQARYAEMLSSVAFAPSQLVASVRGGVLGYPLRASAVLTVAPMPSRLAILQRETE